MIPMNFLNKNYNSYNDINIINNKKFIIIILLKVLL